MKGNGMKAGSARSVMGDALRYGGLFLVALVFLIPFYLIVRNALMTDDQITSSHWVWLPPAPHWENFSKLFKDPEAPMLTGLVNSAVIATVTLVLQMIISSMAG